MDGATDEDTEQRPALGLLSLIVKCSVIGAAFAVMIWFITRYALDWAFFR